MNRPGLIAVGLFLLVLSASHAAQAPVSQAIASATASTASAVELAGPTVFAASLGVTTGTVGPLAEGMAPCFAERYPCAVYAFSLSEEGPIEVTVDWEGDARALMVQLYWAGEGLAHEDVAPRTGPSRISFQRPRMEAADYRLRIVSMEPRATIPFTLALTY